MNKKIKPFTMEWTISRTFDKIIACIDFSVNRVLHRIPEFTGDSDKNAELISTISKLSNLRVKVSQLKEEFLK